MQVWNVLHAARWKYNTQKSAKNSPSGYHPTTLSGYIFATKACIDNRKKNLLNSNISSTCPHNMELRPTNGWGLLASWGHPCKFQWVSHLGSVTARHSIIGRQPNFAALNRGRHLYSAGQPSHWALAHVSSFAYNFPKCWPINTMWQLQSKQFCTRTCCTINYTYHTIKHWLTNCGKSDEQWCLLSNMFKYLCFAVFCNIMRNLKEAICTCTNIIVQIHYVCSNNKSHIVQLPRLLHEKCKFCLLTPGIGIWYGDGAGNTTGENSSVFSLIPMC